MNETSKEPVPTIETVTDCPKCGGRLEIMADGALQCDTCDYRVEA